MNPLNKIWGYVAAFGVFALGLLTFWREAKQSGENEQVSKQQAKDIVNYDREKQAQEENKKIRERVSSLSEPDRIDELLRAKNKA